MDKQQSPLAPEGITVGQEFMCFLTALGIMFVGIVATVGAALVAGIGWGADQWAFIIGFSLTAIAAILAYADSVRHYRALNLAASATGTPS